ncbi:hypothetical protein CYMTET_19363 [Cymbomonas tetramitiformis]|uniref:Uncharacterized protein n=1 Tax=Cymbomonas tetramitiformis TaxID=36881 RepID=A0AAE0L516_9CHLO|nr:hypothetical protein CYMTET_19363 [Cymbomonas tetramitiformis]
MWTAEMVDGCASGHSPDSGQPAACLRSAEFIPGRRREGCGLREVDERRKAREPRFQRWAYSLSEVDGERVMSLIMRECELSLPPGTPSPEPNALITLRPPSTVQLNITKNSD